MRSQGAAGRQRRFMAGKVGSSRYEAEAPLFRYRESCILLSLHSPARRSDMALLHRNHLRTVAQLIEIVGPLLHHVASLHEVLRAVVGAPK